MGYYGCIIHHPSTRWIPFDIGGGSTEVAEIRHGEIHDAQKYASGILKFV